jgi:hypothetical protein
VVVSDLPKRSINDMSVRSCAGHIATGVSDRFSIDPQRMLWVEYYPAREYGVKEKRVIPESFVAVDFKWQKGRALEPKWRPLGPAIDDAVRRLLLDGDEKSDGMEP